ncbi:hypothetical protein KAR91_37440 [Candidatus Pacearchaeota archaeon]|nr:hypothetical protein [Candidatus Pacearchaeota archaeon]
MVDFKFSKDWGVYKKGSTVKGIDKAFARSLQDVRKVGKLVKPEENKVDKVAAKRSTK